MAHSRTESGKIQDEAGRKSEEVLKLRTGVDLSEGHKSQLEDALNGQSYND